MKKSSNSSSNKSSKMNRIETNMMFIRKFEDYFLEKNHMICDYNILHQIQSEKELKKLCGEHMYSNIQGNLEDEDTFKYVIVNSRKNIVAVITGYFEDGELVDICRCSKVPGGGEVLLYYVMLKYNNIHNTKHLRGYISGAIPPIEKKIHPKFKKKKKKD